MNAAQHYVEAERLLTQSWGTSRENITLAQVHATLATVPESTEMVSSYFDEVKRLLTANEELTRRALATAEKRDELAAKIKAVRELHRAIDTDGIPGLGVCENCRADYPTYPCPTIQALDGAE